PVVRDCSKLRELSEALWSSLRVSAQDLTRVRDAWTCLNNVEAICCDCSHSLVFDQPSDATTEAIRNLFAYLYDDCLGLRCYKSTCGDINKHYEQFRLTC